MCKQVGYVLLLLSLGLFSIGCSDTSFTEGSDSIAFRKKSVIINGGDEYTRDKSVELEIEGGLSKCMLISASPNCDEGIWEPYVKTRRWDLKGLNTESFVYVQFGTPARGQGCSSLAENTSKKRSAFEKKKACVNDTILHDDIAPEARFLNNSNWVTSEDKATIKMSFFDNLSGVAAAECVLDNGSFRDCSKGLEELVNLPEGKRTIKVRLQDKAGNVSEATSYQWHVDYTAPVISIVKKPLVVSREQHAAFAFEASDTVTGVEKYECSLDDTTFVSCDKDLHLIRNISEGKHTLRVRAWDFAKNFSEADYIWSVDQSPPILTWDEKPLPYVGKSASSRFRVKVEDALSGVTRIMCRLGKSGDFVPCQNVFEYTSLPLGRQEVFVKAYDRAGNESRTISHNWFVDGYGPSLSFDLSRSVDALTGETEARIYFSAEDVGAGVKGYLCSRDSKNYKECESPLKLVDLSSGEQELWVKAVDKLENIGESQKFIWEVDNILPTVRITQGPKKQEKTKWAKFEFEGADGPHPVAFYECRVIEDERKKRSSTFKKCSSGFVSKNLSQGYYAFEVRAVDRVGNRSMPSAQRWMIDMTPPTARFLKKPAPYIGPDTNAVFQVYTADNMSGVQQVLCQFSTEEGFVPCEDQFVYPKGGEGRQLLKLKLVDGVGNESSVIEHAFYVDATPPQVVFGNKSRGPSTSGRDIVPGGAYKVFFNADDLGGAGVKKIYCRTSDEVNFSECDSPLIHTQNHSGVQELFVKAEDLVGNISAEKSYSWEVDVTPPAVRITNAPLSWSKSRVAEFSFDGSDGADRSIARYECRLFRNKRMESPFRDCVTGFVYRNLSEGDYRFEVKAFDVVGNESSVAVHEWNMDNTPPVAVFKKKPLAFVGVNDPTGYELAVNDAGSGVDEILCRFGEDANFVPCSKAFEYPSKVEGYHSLGIKVRDRAGNVSGLLSHSFSIDATPPVVTFDEKLNIRKIVAAGEHQVHFNVEDSLSGVHEIYCRAPGASSFKVCHFPFSGEEQTGGVKTLFVKAKDRVGNTSQAVSYTWEVDTIAPEVRITRTPKEFSRLPNAVLEFVSVGDAHDLKKYECRLISSTKQNARFATCESGLIYKQLAPGSYRFQVRAVDKVGNLSNVAEYQWTLDNTPPKLQFSAKPAKVIGAHQEAKFSVHVTDDVSGVDQLLCQLPAVSEFKACASDFVLSGTQEGTYSVKVKAKDIAGNESAAIAYSFVRDTTAPTVAFSSKNPNQIVAPGKHNIYFEAQDNLAGVEAIYCKLGHGSFEKCNSPYVFMQKVDGKQSFWVKAKDKVGNVSEEMEFSLKIDAVPPVVTLTKAPLKVTSQQRGYFEFRSNSSDVALYTCKLLMDGSVVREDQNCKSGMEYANLAQGKYKFEVVAQDHVGNVSEVIEHGWVVDTTAPLLSVEVPQEGTKGEFAVIKIETSDPGAGVEPSSLKCYVSGRLTSCQSGIDTKIFNDSDGELKFRVEVADKAGNVASIEKTWQVYRKVQEALTNVEVDANRKVDVLIVVDNSQSMSKEQRHLASRISDFLSIVKETDYHIGITTTDIRNRERGAQGKLMPIDRREGLWFLDASMPSNQAQLYLEKALKRVGTSGNNKEFGIGATIRLLQRKLTGTQRDDEHVKEFIRGDAHMAVLMISDEDDHGHKQDTGIDLLKMVDQHWPKKNFVWNSIIHLPGEKKCSTGGDDERGERYMELTKATNGIAGSICSADYTSILSDMGARVLRQMREVELDCVPADPKNTRQRLLTVRRRNASGVWQDLSSGYKLEGSSVYFDDFIDPGSYKFVYPCYAN